MTPTEQEQTTWAFATDRIQNEPTFNQLREMANHPRLRPLLEQRKDRIVPAPWKFEPESCFHRSSATLQMSSNLTRVFMEPDGILPFQKWLRIALEDVFVVDALAIYIERGAGGLGRPFLRLMDGASIALITDQHGNRPPAYQTTGEGLNVPVPFAAQVINEEPLWLTEREFYYGISEKRPGHVYGYSKIEQVARNEHTVSQMVLPESKNGGLFTVFEPLIGDTSKDMEWLETTINALVMQIYGETLCRFRWLVN